MITVSETRFSNLNYETKDVHLHTDFNKLVYLVVMNFFTKNMKEKSHVQWILFTNINIYLQVSGCN